MRQRPPTHSAASNAGHREQRQGQPDPDPFAAGRDGDRRCRRRRRRPSARRRGSRRSSPKAATARFRSGRRRPQPPATGAVRQPAGRSARSVAARSSSPVRPAAVASDRAAAAVAAGAGPHPGHARIHHRHVRSSHCRRFRDGDRDSTSLLCIHHFDCTAVQFDCPPGDRQAQSGATLGGGAAGETLEDAFPLGGCDTRALIAHLQSQTRRLGRARKHRNAAALRAVPNRRCPPG